ncbi:hypothetical protein M9434_005697 [Picochlorum sp. BPE23]|nr:hypothetical protein M9434_005697 [Picochlorum sp. BPE23]
MEGIVHLRELVQSSQRDKKCSDACGCDVMVCSSGFLHSSREDVKSLCGIHGITYSGNLDVTKTTHLLIPLTKRDLRLCQEYAEVVLKTDKVMKCWEKDIPVVCLDWLFERVGDACGRCRVYNGRAGFEDKGVEEYMWTPMGEASCSTPELLGFSDDHVSPSQEPQCTGLIASLDDESSEYERTPDINSLDSDLLRNFAKVRVTPNSESSMVEHQVASEFTFAQVLHEEDSFEFGHQYEDDFSKQSKDDSSPCATNEMANSVRLQDAFIPGDLVGRAPKGNAVRKRHGIQSRAPGLIQFTYSMVFKNLNHMTIDAKAKNIAVKVKCTVVGNTDDGSTMLVKPLHFYRILGQDWMLEYRPFKVDENGTYEMSLQTEIDSCPVAFISGKVLTSKTQKSRGPPMKPLPLVSATHGHPPYFYRNE